MNGRVFYNEIDPFAAAWLRELIADGSIPDGDVAERDIRDICPGDLDGYVQCHFFAGIGGWARALDLAGWGDAPVWTGSCPCQPFSAAGRGGGTADERHLWPAFFHLIRECSPAIVFGEQVEASVRHGWLDLVCSDLEGEGYAFGAAVLGAHSVGSPHIRQRLWWVAHAEGGQQRWLRERRQGNGRGELPAGGYGADSLVADRLGPRLEGLDARSLGNEREAAGLVGDAGREGRRQVGADVGGCGGGGGAQGLAERPVDERARGTWDDLEWLPCRDGRSRPTWTAECRFQPMADGLWPSMVDSGLPYLSPLATGQKNRVGMLRGAGNAIVPAVAAEFIRSTMETGV